MQNIVGGLQPLVICDLVPPALHMDRRKMDPAIRENGGQAQVHGVDGHVANAVMPAVIVIVNGHSGGIRKVSLCTKNTV